MRTDFHHKLGQESFRIVPRGTITDSQQGPASRWACARSNSTELKIVPRGTKRTGHHGKIHEITLGALPHRVRTRFCYGFRSAGPCAGLRPRYHYYSHL